MQSYTCWKCFALKHRAFGAAQSPLSPLGWPSQAQQMLPPASGCGSARQQGRIAAQLLRNRGREGNDGHRKLSTAVNGN